MNKRTEYVKKYESNTIRKVVLKLNKEKDGEIIKWLEGHRNMTDYIRKLISLDKDNHEVRYFDVD